MRPSAGGDALPSTKPRSRKSSVADPSATHTAATHNVPTNFFLRSEEDMEKSLAQPTDTNSANNQRDSTYGVQSLADALQSAFGPASNADEDDKEDSITRPETVNLPKRQTSSSRGSPQAQDSKSESRNLLQKRHHKRQASDHTLSTPLTPLNIESPAPNSEQPSTPKSASLKSFKLSDEESGLDDAASQVITSGEEEEDDGQTAQSTSFPQLVMPSIQMPSRRPFTTKGKSIGKLKVLVAGEEGIGKTSVIRSIFQICEDIVHVDSLSPTQSVTQTSPTPKPRARKKKRQSVGTSRIMEIHASTKAYPSWWTDLDENRTARRRKSSVSDTVLERNLCFLDTPGYGKSASPLEDMNSVVDYVESLLYQNTSIASMEEGELLGVLSGNGGVQVDVVLYLLSPDHDISKDVEYMQRLSSLTNVIPLIAKADTVSPSEIVAIKTSILARFQTTSIKPFFFGQALDDALLTVQGLAMNNPDHCKATSESDTDSSTSKNKGYFRIPTYPYAISSTQGPDTETMDASLLMSPDYVQPLLPSELAALVTQMFDPDNIAWLRHSAIKKYIAWRRRTQLPGDSLVMHGFQQRREVGSSSSSVGLGRSVPDGKSRWQEPLSRLTTSPTSAASSILSSPSPSGVLVPRPQSPFYLSRQNTNSNLQSPFRGSSPSLSHTHLEGPEGSSDFALTRFKDYAEREEYLGQVRLAKWASDLQRSIRNERERFEELQRSERAKWLLERVSEEVRDGNIVSSPLSSSRADWAVVRHRNRNDTNSIGQRYGNTAGLNSRDPLGLCDLGDEFRRSGFVIVKVLGGMGVLGAVVVAVVRACSGQAGFQEGGLWGWLTGNSE